VQRSGLHVDEVRDAAVARDAIDEIADAARRDERDRDRIRADHAIRHQHHQRHDHSNADRAGEDRRSHRGRERAADGEKRALVLREHERDETAEEDAGRVKMRADEDLRPLIERDHGGDQSGERRALQREASKAP